MRTLFAAIVTTALVACALPALADPSGRYTVAGVNPDGSNYEAKLLVSKVGETYSLTYTLDDASEIKGTAIGDDDVLSLGFILDGDTSGVALMFQEQGSWKGVWSYFGETKLGTEQWRRE